MATTKIWDVHGRIKHVLDYAENQDKTENPNATNWTPSEMQGMLDVMDQAMKDGKAKGLVDALEYAMSDIKTEHRYFVTGINCIPNHARDTMLQTKEKWGKNGGIIAYHGYQSFKPGEVTPELAHKIGVELAQELWGNRFEVIIATHLNSNCIHNHFVFNSVSFKDGLKYYDQKKTYRQMREASDRLCAKYRLSVIERPQYYKKHYAEWRADNEGKPTWRTAIREDVDKAILQSMTWSAFLRALRDQGYDIKTGVKHMAIRPPGKERFVRLRSLGDSYTEEAIKQRILKQRAPSYPQKSEYKQIRKAKVHGNFKLSKATWKGLRALYFFYSRKLREAQRQPERYAPHILREDLRLMDKINEQTIFLLEHKIDTIEQLMTYKENTESEIARIISKRNMLYNEKRRVGVSPSRIQELSDLTRSISYKLKILRRQVWLCGQIAERSVEIALKRKQLKEQDLYSSKDTSREYKSGVQKPRYILEKR